ncbi:MAG: selenide,water dikinase [Myxococcota bacterium]|jgi:selenide,water dikinase
MIPTLVLVGGGHTHIQVLRSFAMAPIAARLIVVVDAPVALYSGMVPGFVEGRYRADALEIDLQPLAKRAGATVIHSRATQLDPLTRLVHLEGRPPITYDVLSVNVGSTIHGRDLPGVREHALATRPMRALVRGITERLESIVSAAPVKVVVVGAGVGGVELACAMEARLAARAHTITLISSGSTILPGEPPRLRNAVERALKDKGIQRVLGHRVVSVSDRGVTLDDDRIVEADITLLATGAAPRALFEPSAVKVDGRGFPLTRESLQLLDHDDVFAVGDCATLKQHPNLPKAGVYAVRQGPVLTENLRRKIAGRRLKRYRPQRDMLVLLSLGHGVAVGEKWGLTWQGPVVWRWKDRIDRRFMERFQVLDADGAPTKHAGRLGMMDDDDAPMMCGGCAAKVGQTDLQRALARLPNAAPDPTVRLGLETPDDAAVIETPSGDRLVISVDGFRAFSNDGWLVGRVAAANAVSDLYATGVTPRYALAMVTIPTGSGGHAGTGRDTTAEQLFQVMSGARATLDPLGVTLLGGHTTVGPELVVGFSVHGVATGDRRLLTKGGMQPGDALVLTHAIGSGALLAADMRGEARGDWIGPLYTQLLSTNAGVAEIATRPEVHACTDVTGFGLLGHLGEMVQASGVSADLDVTTVPLLTGASRVTQRGVRSTFFSTNVTAAAAVGFTDAAANNPAADLLYDPQTSGGLLLSVAHDAVEDIVSALIASGATDASVIGHVVPARVPAIQVIGGTTSGLR